MINLGFVDHSPKPSQVADAASNISDDGITEQGMHSTVTVKHVARQELHKKGCSKEDHLH